MTCCHSLRLKYHALIIRNEFGKDFSEIESGAGVHGMMACGQSCTSPSYPLWHLPLVWFGHA